MSEQDIFDALTPEQRAKVLARKDAYDAADVAVHQAYLALRQWAEDARNTTVTTANAVTVVQTVVTRLGVFFDRFADYLLLQNKDTT